MAICTTAANLRDLAALSRELAGEGGVVYRLLSERPVTCADVRTLAAEAHAAGKRFVVDASEVSPAGTAAAHLGADAVVALAGEEGAASHRAVSDVALAFASYLMCHPGVAEVRYPGLKSDPSYAVAAQVLVGGFGPFVSWRHTHDADWETIDVRGRTLRELIASFEADICYR